MLLTYTSSLVLSLRLYIYCIILAPLLSFSDSEASVVVIIHIIYTHMFSEQVPKPLKSSSTLSYLSSSSYTSSLPYNSCNLQVLRHRILSPQHYFSWPISLRLPFSNYFYNSSSLVCLYKKTILFSAPYLQTTTVFDDYLLIC